MRNFKLLLVLIVGMLAFQACKNDEETANESNIEGTWNVSDFSIDFTINYLKQT